MTACKEYKNLNGQIPNCDTLNATKWFFVKQPNL